MSLSIESFGPSKAPTEQQLENATDIIWEAEKGFLGDFTKDVPRKDSQYFSEKIEEGTVKLSLAIKDTRTVVGVLLGRLQELDSMCLNWIITHPEFREQGIASLLMNEFLQSTPIEIKTITAETKWGSHACQMLKRRGFEVEKVKKFTVRLIKNCVTE